MKSDVVVSIVIFDKHGKLLILKRADDDSSHPGEPDFPGGTVEAGEDLAEAAVRELQEETGLMLTKQDLCLVFGWAQFKCPPAEAIETNRVYLGFLVESPVGQDVQLSHEYSVYSWQTVDKALQDFEKWPSRKKLLEHLRDNNIEPRLV